MIQSRRLWALLCRSGVTSGTTLIIPSIFRNTIERATWLKIAARICVLQGLVLCAVGRSCGIPSRVGFADVRRNDLATRQLIEMMGTDLFVFHGFNEFYFGREMGHRDPSLQQGACERHKSFLSSSTAAKIPYFSPTTRKRSSSWNTCLPWFIR